MKLIRNVGWTYATDTLLAQMNGRVKSDIQIRLDLPTVRLAWYGTYMSGDPNEVNS